MLQSKHYVDTIFKYLSELDSSFDKLSHKYEGKISNLPAYVFNKRFATILKFNNLNYFFIKIESDITLDSDKAFTGLLSSNEELRRLSYPFEYDFDFKNPPLDYGLKIVNASIQEIGNPNSIPVIDICVLCIVRGDRFFDWFSPESARKRAFDEWNNVDKNLDTNNSFVHNLRKIFDKFELILNRDSFIERRLHRFINSHALYLLPSYVKCYFEHKLFLNGEMRKADFILERESGFPSLLIELESSFHRTFKKNDEFALQANHAGEQIREWVKFIDSNSENTKGEMGFLIGPKERLIIIGRGLDCLDAMRDSKFGSNKVWTYDLLIKEAKDKWNRLIVDQCNLIGLENPNTL